MSFIFNKLGRGFTAMDFILIIMREANFIESFINLISFSKRFAIFTTFIHYFEVLKKKIVKIKDPY